MKNIFQKALGVGLLSLGLNGCSKSQSHYLEGEVIKESGSITILVESSGSILGNESIKFRNPSYIVTINTDDGKYIIDVSERYDKPIEALSEAIEVGDKVKFRTNCMGFGEYINYFTIDKIGSVPSNEIWVYKKKQSLNN